MAGLVALGFIGSLYLVAHLTDRAFERRRRR